MLPAGDTATKATSDGDPGPELFWQNEPKKLKIFNGRTSLETASATAWPRVELVDEKDSRSCAYAAGSEAAP
jgi:hypothetical protein